MKRLLILTMAMCSGMLAHADDYPYLTFEQTDGTELSFDVESLEMYFDGGNLYVQNASGSKTLSVSDLKRMYFSSVVDGVTELTASSKATSLSAYDLTGKYVGQFASVSQLQTALPKGIYVVKQNTKTSKIVVK